MRSDDARSREKGSPILLIAGIAVGAGLFLLCCGGIAIGLFFAFRSAAAPPDIVGRWELDEITKLILEFRADGTGTIEVPEAMVRIPITYKLQDNQLTIKAAQPIGMAEQLAVERLERTRVSRSGASLRMEALSGPAQGQAMVLKKIG